MQYNLLKRSVDPKIVGISDGTGQLLFGDDFVIENQWHKQIFQDMPEINIDWWRYWSRHELYAPEELKGLIFKRKSKKTDFIFDLELRGFYVNERLRTILQTAHLPNHKFIPTTFVREGSLEPLEGYYRLVYDLETGEKTVNFAECEYYFGDHERRFGYPFSASINSYEDYMAVFYSTGTAVTVTKLVFNSNFDRELDIFGTQFLAMKSAYISDRLHRKLIEANISGYEVRSLEADNRRNMLIGRPPIELVLK